MDCWKFSAGPWQKCLLTTGKELRLMRGNKDVLFSYSDNIYLVAMYQELSHVVMYRMKIYVCLCVCVCERERETLKGTDRWRTLHR